MSLTVNKILSDIRNIASSGSNPVEFKIEDSQIIFWCDEIRSVLISQALSKRQDISDVWIQKISCLELEQAEESECCNVETGCFVLKTKLTIPHTIETWLDNTIVRVVKPDGSIISKSNPFKAKYNTYNKYTSSKLGWYIKNDYLYITNDQLLETVSVYGLFETPSDLFNYIGCEGACFSYNSNYPCSMKMASMITDIVLKTKVYPFLQLPADNKNDAANYPDQQTNTKGL